MQNRNQELLAIIILGALLALLLVGFIVTMLFLYQKRQQSHKKEMSVMQEEYNQQILRVQFEMQEVTLAEISNKLHDAVKNNIIGIATDIGAIRMKLQKKLIDNVELFQELTRFENDLMIVKEEVRLTSHSISQDKLSQVGLVDTIKFEVNRLKRNRIIKDVVSNINETCFYNFSQQQSVYLFRIFQEIIGNVISHSKATELNINIDILTNNIFSMSVADNGIGFDINEKKKNKLSGIGLSGMQKRALEIGAKLEIHSIPNNGSRIKIELPLPLDLKNNNNGKQQKTQYSFD